MTSSPFPGMDPYLEKHWGDVHHSLIQYTRDELQPSLPRDLRARVEERIFLESPDAEKERQIIPDVHISQPGGFEPPKSWEPADDEEDSEEGGIAVAEPLIFDSVEVREGYIEIRERDGGKLITSIEFVSPSNKRAGAGREKYLQKQRELLESDASLVEIDLLRGGPAVVSLPPEQKIPQLEEASYVASISLGWAPVRWEVYPIDLRVRLPLLPIPLRRHEARLNLDLQKLIDRVYVNGRYDDTDYTATPEPPLPEALEEWAAARLAPQEKAG